MKYLIHVIQFGIILAICYLGDLIHNYLSLPIPGNVLGMVILLIFLLTGVIKLSMIEDVSNFFLKHLAFFFIPAAVGIITCFTILEGKWTALFIISVVSTFIIAVVTGATVQILMRRRSVE
ncbi:CidA/LrgA family protein [Methanolobus sp. WCC4]|uniref:CidA/LrgA family protein n=1 Tax=Methanolobus sp. WCC4 TaxID=3125784 RepID=UPI0030FD0232